MSGFREKFKRAFAVESSESFEPTQAQRDVADRVAREIAKRHLSTPALLFFEMSRPLNYVAAQAMHFFQPIAAIVLDTKGYTAFAEFLEHRGSVDYLCRRVEHFEAEFEKRESEASKSENKG